MCRLGEEARGEGEAASRGIAKHMMHRRAYLRHTESSDNCTILQEAPRGSFMESQPEAGTKGHGGLSGHASAQEKQQSLMYAHTSRPVNTGAQAQLRKTLWSLRGERNRREVQGEGTVHRQGPTEPNPQGALAASPVMTPRVM